MFSAVGPRDGEPVNPYKDVPRYKTPHFSAVLPPFANEEGELIREAWRTGTCTLLTASELVKHVCMHVYACIYVCVYE